MDARKNSPTDALAAGANCLGQLLSMRMGWTGTLDQLDAYLAKA